MTLLIIAFEVGYSIFPSASVPRSNYAIAKNTECPSKKAWEVKRMDDKIRAD
jgi:hypothetical protein